MNILVFDKDTRKYKGNISQIASLIWTERYWECGDFELVLPLSLKLYSKFNLGDYFKIATSNTIMVAEQIEVTSPVYTTEGSINVKGRSLESVLDRRVLLKKFERDSHPAVYIPQLVDECFSGEGRTVDYLVVRHNSNVIIDEKDNEDEENEENKLKISASRGDNLYSLITSSAIAAEIGFRIIFDNNDGIMTFLLYEGSDKTYMRFSELSLTLNEANFYRSIEQFKNYVMVDGKNDDDSDRTVISYDNGDLKTPPIGLSRRELILDYSIGKYENENDKKYDKRLKLKGNEALEEYKEVKTAEGKLISFGKWKIRKDFDLGDIVTLHNDFFTAQARITEIIQSWDHSDGYQIYPGFILKDIKLSTIRNEYPEPDEPEEPDPEPETPDIPDDQTPRKLINVEIISAVKMYTNFTVGGSSRTYHQIYIPNYDSSEPENRPIKRFGVRLRGLLPEGWDASLYTVYCDIFLGSEQKLETIRVKFNDGDVSFIGEWYSYLTYDSPYIRLYLYVVANEIGPADIPDDQDPFMNGFIDIRLNNIEDQEYIPSEEGDQLVCQTTYIWENNGNFHRYFSGNSTNVTGIENVDITVIRQNILSNESILNELDQVIDGGGRMWEYNTSSLNNLELTTVESGLIEIPPADGNYDIPAIGSKFENEIIGELGWRQNVAEFVKSNLSMSRFIRGGNSQEMNLLFKRRNNDPVNYINMVIVLIFDCFASPLFYNGIPEYSEDMSYNFKFSLTNPKNDRPIKSLNLYLTNGYFALSNRVKVYTITLFGDGNIIGNIEAVISLLSPSLTTPIISSTDLYKYSNISVEINIVANQGWVLDNIFRCVFNEVKDAPNDLQIFDVSELNISVENECDILRNRNYDNEIKVAFLKKKLENKSTKVIVEKLEGDYNEWQHNETYWVSYAGSTSKIVNKSVYEDPIILYSKDANSPIFTMRDYGSLTYQDSGDFVPYEVSKFYAKFSEIGSIYEK